ncbi:hypothetical protein SY73_13105 [Salmonella enterica subsp. enterica serovar Saintpaul]|uniref:Copper resistance protein n=1 Tax=Salmonella enterica subsp. enterica serovar Saintpaul TaxID=90105 RepID=A0A601FR79_SALET|nr:hypothetical protein [Salmonella enterica subsp. enterica serovar Saintpaul]
MFHTIVSIKNDGHYFCRAGGNRPDGLNEPVTLRVMVPDVQFIALHAVNDKPEHGQGSGQEAGDESAGQQQ